MPQVRQSLESKYSFAIETHDPNLSVAKGAAIFGWKLALEGEIIDIINEKMEDEDTEDKPFSEYSEEDKKEATKELIVRGGTLGPMHGKAIDLIETAIQNITAKSFGIKLLDENMEEKVLNLITVDDEIPLEIIRTFPTAYENQQGVELVCYENTQRVGPDDEMIELDSSIEVGRATLEFAQVLPQGSEVEITFSLSEDGLLRVFGKDLTTGSEIEASFQTESILSKEIFEEIAEERKLLKVQ